MVKDGCSRRAIASSWAHAWHSEGLTALRLKVLKWKVMCGLRSHCKLQLTDAGSTAGSNPIVARDKASNGLGLGASEEPIQRWRRLKRPNGNPVRAAGTTRAKPSACTVSGCPAICNHLWALHHLLDTPGGQVRQDLSYACLPGSSTLALTSEQTSIGRASSRRAPP